MSATTVSAGPSSSHSTGHVNGDEKPTIVIFDFGSQYSHLIARRVREAGVFCELVSCKTKLSELQYKPVGIVLSGSPHSVYEVDAPHADPGVFEAGVPVFGICYGLQEIVHSFGGTVASCAKKEYGRAMVCLTSEGKRSLLMKGLPESSTFWMSHGDHAVSVPDCFNVLAESDSTPNCVLAHKTKPIFAVQFHPEVTHSVDGVKVIMNFVRHVCNCSQPTWTMESFVQPAIHKIQETVGPHAHVVGAVSGGVDSTVAARLVQMAIGERFHAILVDNGLMRENEASRTFARLRDQLNLNLTLVDASKTFFDRLAGVTDPEKKRKIIGTTFIDVFEAESSRIDRELAAKASAQKGSENESTNRVKFLLQGTLYPDVIESLSYKGPSATIKSHHNVGGLKSKMLLSVIEPLRSLFKDEVRSLGAVLGIERQHLWRHPFPGPGLAIRVVGEVTPERVQIVQKADTIYIEEIRNAGLYDSIAQAYAALLPVRSVGVMGDARTYDETICLRAVETSDFMTADWFEFPTKVLRHISNRIINEVKGVNRVMYDISSKPPATIELE